MTILLPFFTQQYSRNSVKFQNMKKGYKIGKYGWIFDFRMFKQVRKMQEIDIKRLGSKLFKIEKVRTKCQTTRLIRKLLENIGFKNDTIKSILEKILNYASNSKIERKCADENQNRCS